MVANHWFDDGMVTIHRSGLNSINIGEKFSGKIGGKNGGKISIKIIGKIS